LISASYSGPSRDVLLIWSATFLSFRTAERAAAGKIRRARSERRQTVIAGSGREIG
jgi:hypothetical protein